MYIFRLIDTPQFPWHTLNIFVPGNSKSTGKQLIRVLLHQVKLFLNKLIFFKLSNSCIAIQLFNSKISNVQNFWSTIALSLAEFTKLNPIMFLQCLFEVNFFRIKN